MDAQNKKRLVTTRAVAKASLSRLAKFTDEFLPTSDIQLLVVRLKDLPSIRDKFEEAQSQLELFEDVESHASDREQFECAFYNLEAAMNTIIAHRSSENQANNGSGSPHTISTASKTAIKLPTIKLPGFNGDVTSFKHFLDTFVSLVVNNEQLDSIQKFHYLLSSLTGEAHNLIANIPVTSSNFELAFQTVCNRYDNPRLIASAHLKELLNLPIVHKSSVKELRALINQTMSNLNAIKALKLTVPLEELIVSQLILDKLDIIIRKEFETTINTKDFPTLDNVISFLEGKCKSLEIVTSGSPANSSNNCRVQEVTARKESSQFRQSYVATTVNCPYCEHAHTLMKCKTFSQAPVLERREFVKSANLCFNCLKADHKVNKCTSSNCRICNRKHHTLVHCDLPKDSQNGRAPKSTSSHDSEVSKAGNMASSYFAFKIEPRKHILLSTALIKVKNGNGNWILCRALLDSGSQSCFISESCVQRLHLRRYHNRKPIQGIGNTLSETKYGVLLEIGSRVSDFVMSVDCLVLSKVTEDLPGERIDTSEWNLPQNLLLADPNFCEPGKIDILLGTEVCSYIQLSGRKMRDGNHPILHETELGWTLSGRYTDVMKPTGTSRRPVVSCLARIEIDVQQQLQKFWEIEELHHTPKTREEEECEAHFVENTTRDSSGRFVVRLPFKENSRALGDSRTVAARRLHQLEKRLAKSGCLKQDYIQFLNEYDKLGHMELVEPTTSPCFYMPHHAVLKEGSSTTKTRVVFDCSAASSNGISLNDLLLVGPTIQQDICSIILRFRTHAIALTADIAKMYRQIWVHPQDCVYQRILWREDTTSPISEYQLKTVTYGMASAPFLATRCLQQLALDDAHTFPNAAKIILTDFYVDDCISGCSTLDEALQLQQELMELCNKGGFPLRKWCSNHPEVLANISPELRETSLPMQLDKDQVKTLGLLWHPTADNFQVVNGLLPKQYPYGFTKRIVLATVSGIFDPLGFISPIVILCKIFLQQLWQERLTWDQPLPTELASTWKSLYDQLPLIDNVRIDRRVLGDGDLRSIELHGFSDASEKAYGGCLYVRSTNKEGITTVNLLCSKSRVAPLKRLSLPRLELCGALLLARLLERAKKALNLNIGQVCLWSDSTVVLAWILAPSSRWKTFVANRVSEIQRITEGATWRHVSSQENPADLISRGVHPEQLLENKLWWKGPFWLLEDVDRWPVSSDSSGQEEIPEQKTRSSCYVMTVRQEDISTRFSNFTRLQRAVAYCFRFVNNCRRPKEERTSGRLTHEELQQAHNSCIRTAQLEAYSKEIHQLESRQSISNNSRLRSLNPFLDGKGLLRIGGRLDNSEFTYDQKHPLILPPNHHLTELIVNLEHRRLLHAGCQLLLASLRQRYWIVNGRTTVRRLIHQCVICFRIKPDHAKQLMGQLPQARVTPTRPFLNCGIDYTGPFIIKSGSCRTKSKVKCYVALFVCLATKAVHLEIVSNLSTQAFLAALKRFVSRRGRCQTIYSDNGTNFVGAKRELKELQDFLRSRETREGVQHFSDQEGIEWKFIPPSSPHFGGLWEAGVKSFKYHLRRVMGSSCLTFEELSTLTCQIEACLNSRPLIPLSSDPNDLDVLTPGHFLIGTAPTTLPQPDLGSVKLSLLSRWEKFQQQLQAFWRRWSWEYIHHLQQRSKWTHSANCVKPGVVVIAKEDNLSPLYWKLAVIDRVHPGKDGLVRVATIRTANGLYKRPIATLCPLPTAAEN